MPVDINHLRTWIGREEVLDDVVTLAPVRALSATLDRDDPPPKLGDGLPPCWHWLYFLPTHRQSMLSADGHAERGGFLPPVPLPRRMWAGSRMVFHRPVALGSNVTRRSRIVDVALKQGKLGPLVFVTVRHEINDEHGLALVDEHDIVYRDAPNPADPIPASKSAPLDPVWVRTIMPDDVLLFRYSALTFNGHRIHYDRRYVTEVEGYPGLIVHGPLIATLLLDLLRRHAPSAVVKQFQFRAVKPIFDLAAFKVCARVDPDGTPVQLWAQHEDGSLAMDATATIA